MNSYFCDLFSFNDIDFTKLRDLFVYNSDPMLFNSGFFLLLFTGFLLLYLDLRKQNTLRILYVVVFSYYFYYKSSGVFSLDLQPLADQLSIINHYLGQLLGYTPSAGWSLPHIERIPRFVILLFVTIWDYHIARRLFACTRPSRRTLLLTSSIVVNIGLLCYFKYTNLIYQLYCGISQHDFVAFDIILPVGISFFTFQSMSYTIDVYRKQLRPLDSFFDYAFYISFFPQLVAGPIVRARDFIPQIRQKLWVSHEMFGKGIFLILTGLFKKTVISDYISINFVDRIFDNPTLYSGVENLLGVYGYALQIYCDFSGYSDMAIGFALLLGFHFNLNFDSPYKSASITEFWRRWHISLSSWLRDYLYISLGGSRKGKIRTYINLLITMLLGGLWHGASISFLVWGALHGVALAVHKWLMGVFPSMKIAGSQMSIWRRLLGIFITFHLVCFSWVFFRASDFTVAFDVLGQIFSNFQVQILTQLLVGYKYVFLLMLFGYVLHFMPSKWEKWSLQQFIDSPFLVKALVVFCMIVFIMQVKSVDVLAFIYFQF